MAASRAIMLLNIFVLLALFDHSASQILSITVPKDVWLVNNQGLNADGLDSGKNQHEHILPCLCVVI